MMRPFVSDDPLVGKAQWIRAADVIVVGPLMIAGGIALHRNVHPLAGWALGVLGLGTILLNGYNFVRGGAFTGGLRGLR
jgi:hypothetical protein